MTILVVDKDWEMHSPVAHSLVVASKEECPVGLLQGDLIHGVSQGREMIQVSKERSMTHEKRRSTRVHHCAVMQAAPELSSKVIRPDSKVQEEEATPSTACRLPEEVGAGRSPAP